MKRLGGFILGPIDLHLPRGIISCLLGPSGSGKSTFLRVIAGLLRPDSGRVLIDGIDVYGKEGRRVLKRVSFLPQDDLLIEELTVYENLKLALKAWGFKGNVDKAILNVAEALELRHLLDVRPARLSGGERRKAFLAIALVKPHDYLLLDEPSNSLDLKSTETLKAVLKEEVERGIGVILATHDIRLIDMCDLIAELRCGSLIGIERKDESGVEYEVF